MLGKFKSNFKKLQLDEDKKNIEFEKGDFLALVLAAGSVMIPVVILIFIFIALLVKTIF